MKLHLPKQLFTALLTAITLAAAPAALTLGSAAWGAAAFTTSDNGTTATYSDTANDMQFSGIGSDVDKLILNTSGGWLTNTTLGTDVLVQIGADDNDGTTGLVLNDGGSGTYTIANKVIGSGLIEKTGNGRNMVLQFTGDVSEYAGDINLNSKYTFTLWFGGQGISAVSTADNGASGTGTITFAQGSGIEHILKYSYAPSETPIYITNEIVTTGAGTSKITIENGADYIFTNSVGVTKLDITAGSLTLRKEVSADTLTMTGSSVLTVEQGAKLTATEIKSDGGANTERSIFVNEGASVTTGTLWIAYNMGSVDVDGELTVNNELKFATQNTNNSLLTGEGSVSAQAINATNYGSYGIDVNTLKVDEGGIAISQNSVLNLAAATTTVTGTTTVNSGSELNFKSGAATLTGEVTNSGTIHVNGGEVAMNGGMRGAGSLSIAEGAELIIAAGSTMELAHTITGTGTLTLNGTLNLTDISQLSGYSASYSDGASGFFNTWTAQLMEGTLVRGNGASITATGMGAGSSLNYDAETGYLTATLASDGVYYVNDTREYSDASMGTATSLNISSTGTLSIGLSDVGTKPISNSGKLNIAAGTENVTLNTLLSADKAITQTATGITSITTTGTVSTDGAIAHTTGTLKIQGESGTSKATLTSSHGWTVGSLELENITATLTKPNSGGDQTLKLTNLTLNAGATLNITGGSDFASYSADTYTWTVNEGAVLWIGTTSTAARQTLGRNFRLVLAGGEVNGRADSHGTLDYYNSNETGNASTGGTIEVTKSSTLNAAVRARTGKVIFKIDGEDTVLTMGNATAGVENYAALKGDGIFEKIGTGTLLYKGATFNNELTVSTGVFEYNVSSNITHSGVIKGNGTFKKSGSGTLTLSNATVASLNVAAGKLIYQLADNAETEVDHTLALELDSSASFEKTGEGTLNVGALHEAQFGAGIVVSQGVLQYNGDTGEKVGNPPKFVYLLRDVETTGTGKVQVVGDVKFNWTVHAASARTETVSSKVNVTGNLEINTWSTPADVDGDSMTRWEVVDNGLLEVGGKLWMTNLQKLVVNGGAVDAGSVYLGHSTNSSGNLYSKVVIADGSLTTGNIAFVGGGNAVSMTGGVLTFTPETENKQVLVDGGHTGAGTISISGGTLAATTTDWTMTGTSNHQISLGNVTFDVAAGKTVTLAGSYDLTGSLSLIGNTVVENESTSTGALTLTGTMNITSLQNLKHAEGQYAEGIADSNGFNLYYYYLVENTDGASISTAGLSVTLSGAAVDVLQSSTGNHLLIYDGSQTGVYHVNTGTVSATNDIMGTEGFERYHVAKNANLAIDTSAVFSEDNRNSVLTSTTGSGSLVLSASASFGGLATVFQGDIRVTNGATLTLGALSSNQASVAGTTNVSSLSGIVLDGGNLKYQGSTGSIQSITALSDADFTIFDMTATNSVADTLSVGKVIVADGTTLTVNGASDGSYKHHLSVGQLSGAGDLTVYGAGNTTWSESQASFLTISSLEDFTGNISITSREKTRDGAQVDVYHAIVNTGVSGAVLKSLQFAGFGEQGENSTAVFNVQGDTQVDTLVATRGSVNLDAGTTLTLGGGTAETRKEHSIGTLSAAAAGVTLGDYVTLTLGGGTAEAQKQHSIGTLTGRTGSMLNLEEHSVLNTITSASGVTLTGSGTYVLASGTKTMTSGVTLGEDWTGAVRLSGSFAGLNLNDCTSLYNEDSWIEFAGVSGYMAMGTNISFDANIRLTDIGETPAINHDNGGSGDIRTFTGKIGGTGTWKRTRTNGTEQSYEFAGDVSGWTGAFVNAIGAKHNNTATATNLTFQGASDINVNISNPGAAAGNVGALNVTINDVAQGEKKSAVAVNGSIQATKLTVDTAVSADFSNTVDVDTLEVNSGKTATFNNTATAGAVTNAGQIQLGKIVTNGEEKEMQVVATVAGGTMSKVQMSSTGITGTAQDGSSSISDADIEIAQLAQDASFTIEDMTLVNTTITAATTTEVKLNNVTATNTMLAVGKNYTLSGLNAATVSAPEVGTGGSITYSTGLGVASGATLTLNLDVLGAVEQHGSGVYDITITLDGFGANYAFTQEDLAGLVKFDADSWLGEALTGASTSVTVDGETISAGAAAQSSGAPSVSYNATSASDGNVGSLVITINGLNVPEPASATLGLAALMMLAARRRRKA